MKAKVVIGGRESDLFDVLVGVRQGCVLAPAIFNLFLVAVTLACRNGLPYSAGIPYPHLMGKYINDVSMSVYASYNRSVAYENSNVLKTVRRK